MICKENQPCKHDIMNPSECCLNVGPLSPTSPDIKTTLGERLVFLLGSAPGLLLHVIRHRSPNVGPVS